MEKGKELWNKYLANQSSKDKYRLRLMVLSDSFYTTHVCVVNKPSHTRAQSHWVGWVRVAEKCANKPISPLASQARATDIGWARGGRRGRVRVLYVDIFNFLYFRPADKPVTGMMTTGKWIWWHVDGQWTGMINKYTMCTCICLSLIKPGRGRAGIQMWPTRTFHAFQTNMCAHQQSRAHICVINNQDASQQNMFWEIYFTYTLRINPMAQCFPKRAKSCS
jgi:hypothetical protein